ncbi:unnamed protein product [Thelazia callipaeda]|uniref:THAP-type domain-containing protein n=1 Tax=Thelazia callipaeda TaxID=103827 RepID=A0A0N5CNU5_THECL|nr:unnamed protein product [Thelazia callipaeda]
MEKCVFCGWYRRTNDPSLKFFGIPREPGLKRVCGVHFRQGRPSNDPSHEDFAPHLYIQRSITQPVSKTLTYLESFANEDELDEVPSVSRSSGRTYACKPSILRKKRRTRSPDDPKKIDQESTKNQQGPSSDKVDQVIEQKASKEDLTNVVVISNPITGAKKRMRLLHIPRPFAEAVGIKPGQSVIFKRRLSVAKPARNQAQICDNIDFILGKEENLDSACAS